MERGWFICETADPSAAKPVAVVGMIEDVKGKGAVITVERKVTVQPRHSENRTACLLRLPPLFSSLTGAQLIGLPARKIMRA
ncbi:hypothetical protein [Lachnoclostridium sp. An76]|uniref:hypothetical protein n=1 Tax=Lachnoclostridium sp. An76 TaxID=1965654 RepID=UPI000B3AE130|nr:hypothetical protein [Lachnoclostridium sp. An76]OUN34469.1 hypothetical protein B5G27_06845 [Lachnoclostridium sp. An76]